MQKSIDVAIFCLFVILFFLFKGFSIIEEESGKEIEGKITIISGLFDLPGELSIEK